MSRTTRNRRNSFEYSMVWVDNTYTKKELGRLKAHWMNHKYYGWSMSKSHRNDVNRIRRKKDRHEIYKAVNFYGYEELCSNWNCKDADQWGYF